MKFGCVIFALLFFSNAAAQKSWMLDSLYNSEEFSNVTDYFEKTTVSLDKSDSTLAAKSYFQQQQYAKAFSLFYKLYTAHPTNLSLLVQSFSSAFPLHQYPFIFNAAKKAISGGVENKSVYHYAVLAAQKLSFKNDAQSFAAEGWRKFPLDTRLAMDYAGILQESNLYDSSLKIIMPVLTNDTMQISLLEKAVKAFYMTDDYKNAVVLANYLLKKEVYNTHVLLYQLYSYYEAKQYNSAVVLVKQLTALNEATPSMFLIGAKAALAQKNYGLSAQWLREGYDEVLDKQGVSFLHSLADVAAAQHQFDAADKYYDTAIYIYHLPFSHYLKGANYMEAGKKEKALKEFSIYKISESVKKDTSAHTKMILDYIRRVQATK